MFVISDYKYFFLPYDEAEIGAIEGWLELMAERGFKLTHIKGRFFGFEELSTGKVSYCIHLRTDDACRDIHEWKYVGRLSLYFDIFISEDNNDADKPDINLACMETALGYDVNYYEMRNEGLAVRYVEESCRDIDYEKMTAIHVDGFESASYFLKRNYQNRKTEDIVLRSGNIVITAMYYGSGSLLDSVHHFSMAVPY